MTLPIHQDRPIRVPASKRKFIHAQNSSWAGCRVGKPTDQSQEAIATAEQPQPTTEALPWTSPDLQPDQLQGMAQGSRSARVRHGGSELLGEGLPRTVWVETAEASDNKVKQDGNPTDGQINELAHVVTVDVRGLTLTLGADGTTSTTVRHEMDQPVHVSHLSHGQELTRSPLAWDECLAVHPPCSIGIPLDLEVLAQLLIAYGAAFPKQDLDLLADEGVSFDCGRVMGLLVPDVGPDTLGLFGRWQTTETGAQLGHLLVEARMHSST